MSNPPSLAVPAPFRRRAHLLVILAWVVVCVVVTARISRHAADAADREQDIHYIYLEGRGILDGVNPYARIIGSDMRHNDKFATYLPGIYLAAAAACALGLREYPRWLDAWWGISLLFWGGVGALVFSRVYGPRRCLVAALAASALWLFNRWSLYVFFVAHTDFLAVFFFVLGAVLLPRRPRWAWLAYGISLSVKHIAILALPVLLVAQWRAVPAPRRRRELAWSLAAMAAVPLAVSLPFFLADPVAFVQSMLFSVTRTANTQFELRSVVVPLNLRGPEGRVPMLLLVAAITWLYSRGRVGLHAALALVMLTFAWFNSIFFRQYAVWPIPFALMALFEEPAPPETPAPPPAGT